MSRGVRGVERAILVIPIALACGLVWGQEASRPSSSPQFLTPREAAEGFLAAYRAEDDAAMRALTEAEASDPFFVAYALFGLHLDSVHRTPPGPGDFLAAARALAERAKTKKAGEGLERLVAQWATFGPERLAQEARLRSALLRMEEANSRGKGEDALSVAREIQEDLGRVRGSATTALLRFEEGKTLSAMGRPAEAAELYREAARTADDLGWPTLRADALFEAGKTEWLRGEYPGARTAFEEAHAIREALGDRKGAARALGAIGNCFFSLADYPRALDLYERCVRGLEASGDRLGAATFRGNLGQVHERLGEFPRALGLYERVLEEMKAIGDRPGVARTLGILGSLHRNLGEYARAREFLEAALREMEALGDRAGAALARGNLGILLGNLGEYARALECHERTLHDVGAVGDRPSAARTLSHIGSLYLALGRSDRALDFCERALAEMEALGARSEAAAVRGLIGGVYRSLGEHGQVIEWSERSLQEMEALGERLHAPATRAILAAAYTSLRQHEKALEINEQALEEWRALGNRVGEALSLVHIGASYAGLGRDSEGLESCQRGLREIEVLGDSRGKASALHQIADIHLRLGDPSQALANAHRAVEILTPLGTGFGEEEAFPLREGARPASDLGLLAAEALFASEPKERSRALSEAFWFAESGRGLLLAEALLNREALLAANVAGTLLEADCDARARIAALTKRLAVLASGKEPDPDLVAAAKGALDAAYRAREDAIARIQREARRVAGVVYPTPIGIDGLRGLLPAETVLVLFQLTAQKAVALVVGRGGAECFDLGRTEDLVEKVQDYLVLSSVAGSAEERQAEALYDALLRPLEKALAGKSRLLVSPDGILTFLPFEALFRREGEKRERLLESLEVAYVPSGTVYAALLEDARGRTRGEGLLALGDPIYPGEREGRTDGLVASRDAELRGLASLPRLRGSGEEVRAIGSLFPEARRTLLLRENASASALTEALAETSGRLAAAHFACHGFVDTERPRLTGLVLSGGEVLTLEEVYRLRVPADLVVLSACETGKGKLLHGEGVMGLVRGFFFAGAPRVVVSNWRVADESTRPLMVSFYRKMIEEGLAPGAALREAKRERLRAGGRFAHPYHWAAFVLWGLWD